MATVDRLTSEAVRAARSLLRWEQSDLAEASGISLASIKRLESQQGPLSAQAKTIEGLRATLSKYGVSIHDDGAQIYIQFNRLVHLKGEVHRNISVIIPDVKDVKLASEFETYVSGPDFVGIDPEKKVALLYVKHFDYSMKQVVEYEKQLRKYISGFPNASIYLISPDLPPDASFRVPLKTVSIDDTLLPKTKLKVASSKTGLVDNG